MIKPEGVAQAQGYDPTIAPVCPDSWPIGEGTGTPGPDNTAWDWWQDCQHCVGTPEPAEWDPLAPLPTATNPFIFSTATKEPTGEFRHTCWKSELVEYDPDQREYHIPLDDIALAGKTLYGVELRVYPGYRVKPSSPEGYLLLRQHYGEDAEGVPVLPDGLPLWTANLTDVGEPVAGGGNHWCYTNGPYRDLFCDVPLSSPGAVYRHGNIITDWPADKVPYISIWATGGEESAFISVQYRFYLLDGLPSPTDEECGIIVYDPGTPVPTNTPGVEATPTYVFNGRSRFDVAIGGQFVNGAGHRGLDGCQLGVPCYWSPTGWRGFSWDTKSNIPVIKGTMTEEVCVYWRASVSGPGSWNTWDWQMQLDASDDGDMWQGVTGRRWGSENGAYFQCGKPVNNWLHYDVTSLIAWYCTGDGCGMTVTDIWVEFPLAASEPTPTPSPTVAPTVVPTGTPTALPLPTPGPVVDLHKCEVVDWATEPLGEFGVDGNLVSEEAECFTLVPGFHISVPELPLGIGGGQEIQWDPVGLCVYWVSMPRLSLLGVKISVDWFLVPVLAWFVRRLLAL